MAGVVEPNRSAVLCVVVTKKRKSQLEHVAQAGRIRGIMPVRERKCIFVCGIYQDNSVHIYIYIYIYFFHIYHLLYLLISKWDKDFV